MSDAATGDASEPAATVPHEEWLLRLNFNPEHIVEGEVIPTAISLTDLKQRGYSIDREGILDLSIVTDRARDQAASKPDLRKAPFLSRFECGPVCNEVVIPEAQVAFLVEVSPVKATETQRANPAHAHIRSAVPRPDSGLRRLRLLLLPHLQHLVALEDYARGLEPREEPAGGLADT